MESLASPTFSEAGADVISLCRILRGFRGLGVKSNACLTHSTSADDVGPGAWDSLQVSCLL